MLLIDSAGNLMLGDVEKGVRMPIGQPLAPEQRSRVSCAVWSPTGQWTAWSVDSESSDGIQELRLHLEATDEAGVLADSVSAFYLCPSPSGRWLSHLSPGPLGLELAVTDVLGGELRIIERGEPLFWSWSADSSHLAVHVESRVLVTGFDGTPPRLLTDHAGPFVVPWWMPGGSVVFAIDDRIVATGPDDAVNTLVGGGSAGRFSPGPDGRRLAHVEVGDGRGRLVIVDLLTADRTVVTDSPVAGFFWSPDGSLLAALIAADDRPLQWVVCDGFATWLLASFHPGRTWATSVLPFFEQYAQSHSHWSGDSTRLIAPAVDDNGMSGALIQAARPPHTTQWLPDADLVWWA